MTDEGGSDRGDVQADDAPTHEPDDAPLDDGGSEEEREPHLTTEEWYENVELDDPWFLDVAKETGFTTAEVSDELWEEVLTTPTTPESIEPPEAESGPKRSKGAVIDGVDRLYVVDYNQNSRPDIMVLPDDTPLIFENQGGEYEPVNVFPEIEVDVDRALFFDHDNSGYEDLYLLSRDGSVFLENIGGEFIKREVGLEVEFEVPWGVTADDYTGNGCLDVFVVQIGRWSEERPVGFNRLDVSLDEDNGGPNRLFAGDCESFRETTEEAGIRYEAHSLAASFVDLTGDGTQDIHVANDYNNDVLYLNNGDGTFEHRVLPDFTNRNGMASEVADVTGNGLPDIFVTNIYYDVDDFPGEVEEEVMLARIGSRFEGNNLLLNQGDGEFRDAAVEYGVQDGGWGWAAELRDFDNSGQLDLLHADENRYGEVAPPRVWRGEGEGFEKVNGTLAGFIPTREQGLVALDYDLDGSLDVASDNIESRYRLYENQRSEGNALQVELKPDGHTVFGSSVTVHVDGESQTRFKKARSDYKSQSTRILHFGVGDEEKIDKLDVEWADGTVGSFEGIEAGQRVQLQPDGDPETVLEFG